MEFHLIRAGHTTLSCACIVLLSLATSCSNPGKCATEGMPVAEPEAWDTLKSGASVSSLPADCFHVELVEPTDSNVEELLRTRVVRRLRLTSALSITDNAMQKISACTTIEVLEIYDAYRITDQGFSEVQWLNNLCRLSIGGTVMGCTHISDASVRSFAKLPRLRDLTLGRGVKLTNVAFSHLRSTRLRSLRLISEGIGGEKEIDDFALEQIAMIKTLESLTLSSQSMKSFNFSAVGISKLKHLAHLASLSLRGCDALDAEVATTIGSLSTLESLELRQCLWLTDKGVGELGRLSSLSRLVISGCPLVTPRGVEQLHEAIPKCTVVFSN